MSVVAEFTAPATNIALEYAFREVPGVTVEAERLASHSREWVLPFLWASGGDPDAFETALREDPSVVDVTAADAADGVGHYAVQWREDVMDLVDAIVDRHGIVLEATGGDGRWQFTLRFLDRGDLDQFREYFTEYSFELQRIAEDRAPAQRSFGLTPEQHETLQLALREGYFDVPREITLTALAERLDISSNAVSQRLRRGTAALVGNTLSPADGELAGVD